MSCYLVTWFRNKCIICLYN